MFNLRHCHYYYQNADVVFETYHICFRKDEVKEKEEIYDNMKIQIYISLYYKFMVYFVINGIFK